MNQSARPQSDATLVETRLELMPQRVNANAALLRRGRYVHLTFLLAAGQRDYLLVVEQGRLVSVSNRQLATASGSFSLRAGIDTWLEHWQPIPRRNFHDLFSMLSAGLLKIDGDLLPFMQNLQYFKDVIASVRQGNVND